MPLTQRKILAKTIMGLIFLLSFLRCPVNATAQAQTKEYSRGDTISIYKNSVNFLNEQIGRRGYWYLEPSTIIDFRLIPYTSRLYGVVDSSLYNSLIFKLRETNLRSVPLNSISHSDINDITLDLNEGNYLDSVINIDSDSTWRLLRAIKKFNGFIAFSRIVFSENNKYALVLIRYSSGYFDGADYLTLLKREENEWRIVNSDIMRVR